MAKRDQTHQKEEEEKEEGDGLQTKDPDLGDDWMADEDEDPMEDDIIPSDDEE